jgi:hypothetical protein
MKKWTKDVLKSQMLREKQFLKELFDGTDETKKKRILNLGKCMQYITLIHKTLASNIFRN